MSPRPATTRSTFLEALDRWATALRGVLESLDAASQQATNPSAYTADVTLAMSLSQSISARRDELVTAWDSGRVGPDEMAKLAVLLWGRLPDPLGAPSAFTLSEACTLVAALADRLTIALPRPMRSRAPGVAGPHHRRGPLGHRALPQAGRRARPTRSTTSY